MTFEQGRYINDDAISLGSFMPSWETHESYERDREILFLSAVIARLQQMKLRVRIPFSLRTEAVDVRVPEWHVASYQKHQNPDDYAFDGDNVGKWHCDVGGSLGNETLNQKMWMAVWANIKPTEVRMHGQVFAAAPYEILLFRNGAFVHRIPSMTANEAAMRYFGRIMFPAGRSEPLFRTTTYKV